MEKLPVNGPENKKDSSERKSISGKLRKIASIAGISLSALIHSGKADAQKVEPYYAKDDEDYRNRKEMYDDSLHAYNESQKSVQIFKAASLDEAEKQGRVKQYSEEKINELVKLRNKATSDFTNAKDQKIKETYKNIESIYQKSINALTDPYYKSKDDMDKRFDKYTTNGRGSRDSEMHDPAIYTKNKKNNPKDYLVEDTKLNNEAYTYQVPLYAKPKQEVRPHKKEVSKETIEAPAVVQKKEESKPLPPKIENITPGTFMMPDGRKYSYDELLKAYPSLKDPKVFEFQFHRKPPKK